MATVMSDLVTQRWKWLGDKVKVCRWKRRNDQLVSATMSLRSIHDHQTKYLKVWLESSPSKIGADFPEKIHGSWLQLKELMALKSVLSLKTISLVPLLMESVAFVEWLNNFPSENTERDLWINWWEKWSWMIRLSSLGEVELKKLRMHQWQEDRDQSLMKTFQWEFEIAHGWELEGVLTKGSRWPCNSAWPH